MDKLNNLAILLDSIVWGIRIVDVNDKVFAFRPLTLSERNAALFIRENIINRAKRDGKPSKNELILNANRLGLWNSQKDKHVELLKKELAERKQELGVEKFKTKKSKLEKRISIIEFSLGDLLSLHAKLIELPSAEHYADQEHAIYIIQCTALEFPSMKQYWPTYQDIQNEENTELVSLLIRAYSSYKLTDIHKIRELARSSFWRIRWATAKSCGAYDKLFNLPLTDLTSDQLMLLHWSQVYDSIYESIDRPPDYIIDDDKELDKWIERQVKEREQESRKRFQSKKSSIGMSKISSSNANEIMMPAEGVWCDICNCGVDNKLGARHASNCPYGVFLYYINKEKIDKEVGNIQSTNPDQVRFILAKQFKRLEGKGWIRDENLKDDVSRNIMGFTTSIHKQGEKPI